MICPGLIATIGAGTLIAASENQARLIGKPYAAQSLAKDMLGHDEGTMTTVGLDGVPDGYRAMNDREALKVLIRP